MGRTKLASLLALVLACPAALAQEAPPPIPPPLPAEIAPPEAAPPPMAEAIAPADLPPPGARPSVVAAPGFDAAAPYARLAGTEDDPFFLRRTGLNQRRTGLALMVLGGLNLTMSLGMGVWTLVEDSRGGPDRDNGMFVALGLATSIGGLVVGAILTAAGVPTYVKGARRTDRASRILAAYPMLTPALFGDLPEVRRQQKRRDGLILLGVGAGVLAVGLVGVGLAVGGIYADDSGGAVIAGMVLALTHGPVGITLLGVGGSYHRASRSQAPLASLHLTLGNGLGVAGRF